MNERQSDGSHPSRQNKPRNPECEEDVSLWSEEELIRGTRKDRNGKWVGRPPKVVPKALHDELVRRKMDKAFTLLRENIVAPTEVLVELATDSEVESGVRLKAATTILDRVLGKAPETLKLHVAQEPPWAVALRSALAVHEMGEIVGSDIVDAEVVNGEV